MKDTFAERIIDHSGEGDPISKPHRGRILHVLFALRALARQHELDVSSPCENEPGHFEKITDAFLGNDPTDLANKGTIVRNRKASAESSCRSVI